MCSVLGSEFPPSLPPFRCRAIFVCPLLIEYEYVWYGQQHWMEPVASDLTSSVPITLRCLHILSDVSFVRSSSIGRWDTCALDTFLVSHFRWIMDILPFAILFFFPVPISFRPGMVHVCC